MTYQIRSYELPLSDVNYKIKIDTPRLIHLLEINQQNGKIFAWGIFDCDSEITSYDFVLYGTTSLLTKEQVDSWVFFKTVFMPNGLVWHIGMLKKESVFLLEDDNEPEDIYLSSIDMISGFGK